MSSELPARQRLQDARRTFGLVGWVSVGFVLLCLLLFLGMPLGSTSTAAVLASVGFAAIRVLCWVGQAVCDGAMAIVAAVEPRKVP
jgi:hypothetical protein